MTTKLLIFSQCLFFIGCVAPKQPMLTLQEKKLLDSLEIEWDCKVERYIDVSLLVNNPEEKGAYGLAFDLDCERLQNFHNDSLQIIKKAKDLAKYVNDNIIMRDTKYHSIEIQFVCDNVNNLPVKNFIVDFPHAKL